MSPTWILATWLLAFPAIGGDGTSLFLRRAAFDVALQPPASAGETLSYKGSATLRTPYSARVPLTGLCFVAIEPAAKAGDLDLEASAGERTWWSKSHRARERLLVRASGALEIKVSGHGAFRLSLTRLAAGQPLALGKRRVRLEPASPKLPHVRLFHVGAELGPLDLRLRRVEGKGDVDLYAFDARLEPVTIAEVRRSAERARLPAGARFLALVCRGSAASAVLEARRLEKEDPLERFLARLARTPDQRKAIAALRRNPDFLRIEAYLRAYPHGLPLQLQVVPGLMAHGVERFGTYSQGTLTINPTIGPHKKNPLELVDTVVHELIHALLAVPLAEGYPLAPDVLDSSHDPKLRGVVGSPLRRSRIPADLLPYLESVYGPSASNPGQDFTDLNAKAQELVVKLIRDVAARSKVGKETLVFKNVKARETARVRESPEPAAK